LASYKNLLKVDPSSLVVSQAETDGQNWYIAFEQRYKNLPVYGASAGITIHGEGKIVSIGADAYPDVQVATAPDISEQQAEEVAKSDFTTADMDTVFRRSPNRLLIYPETSNNAIIYHLAYIVELQSNTPLKGLRYFIDAHSGATIAKEGVFRDGSISGNVSGQYWPEQQNVNTSTEAPKYLSSLVVKNSIGQVVTTGTINSSGNYNLSWSANSGTFFLESKL
jgi:hypothetical protein